MPLRSIRMSNFMAFKDTGWIALTNINLLYGRNSTGKSAIFRALRLLKQSNEYRHQGAPFIYHIHDGLDIGEFEELLHDKEENLLGFYFRCLIPSNLIRDVATITDENAVIDYCLEYAWNKSQNKAELITFSLLLIDGEQTKILLQVEKATFTINISKPEIIILTDLLNQDIFTRKKAVIWSEISIKNEVGFLPDLMVPAENLEKSDQATQKSISAVRSLEITIRGEIVEFLNSIIHIQPVRPVPSHLFVLTNQQQQSWTHQGMQPLLELLSNKLGEDQLISLEYWLEKLELGKKVQVSQHSPYPQKTLLSILMIEDISNSKLINIENMGFGSSQVLPIILTTLLSEPDTLLLIEQPELHLHPETQSALVDFLIHQSSKSKRFIIETHSEYMLLRLQRRVAEATLSKHAASNNPSTSDLRAYADSINPENFNLFFINREGNNSVIETIKLDDFGELTTPSREFIDFFKRDYEDVMYLDLAQAEIKKLINKQ